MSLLVMLTTLMFHPNRSLVFQPLSEALSDAVAFLHGQNQLIILFKAKAGESVFQKTLLRDLNQWLGRFDALALKATTGSGSWDQNGFGHDAFLGTARCRNGVP